MNTAEVKDAAREHLVPVLVDLAAKVAFAVGEALEEWEASVEPEPEKPKAKPKAKTAPKPRARRAASS